MADRQMAPDAGAAVTFGDEQKNFSLPTRQGLVGVARCALYSLQPCRHGALRQRLAQIPVPGYDLPDRAYQFSGLRTLHHVPRRAVPERLDDVLLLRVHREYDHGGRRRLLANPPSDLETVQSWHRDGHDQHARLEALDKTGDL